MLAVVWDSGSQNRCGLGLRLSGYASCGLGLRFSKSVWSGTQVLKIGVVWDSGSQNRCGLGLRFSKSAVVEERECFPSCSQPNPVSECTQSGHWILQGDMIMSAV